MTTEKNNVANGKDANATPTKEWEVTPFSKFITSEKEHEALMHVLKENYTFAINSISEEFPKATQEQILYYYVTLCAAQGVHVVHIIEYAILCFSCMRKPKVINSVYQICKLIKD